MQMCSTADIVSRRTLNKSRAPKALGTIALFAFLDVSPYLLALFLQRLHLLPCFDRPLLNE
jgi:hypothetical protein